MFKVENFKFSKKIKIEKMFEKVEEMKIEKNRKRQQKTEKRKKKRQRPEPPRNNQPEKFFQK
jgi:hypothetical protein